jgi:hypothetical protein
LSKLPEVAVYRLSGEIKDKEAELKKDLADVAYFRKIGVLK